MSESEPHDTPLAGLRILVVEDEMMIAMLMEITWRSLAAGLLARPPTSPKPSLSLLPNLSTARCSI
ncbi:MAG TPA: hypothetical protein VHY35_01335 [Stellaceae bacterium]|jgi:hypothetical protein|nr:hypothetical protein [Stellaceae bacterium]